MKVPFEALTGLSIGGFFLTLHLIPKFRDSFIKANLFGVDLNKSEGSRIPEATGVISGCVFLILTFLLIPFTFSRFLFSSSSSSSFSSLNFSEEFPHSEFVQLLAALLSISSMLLLGFADDVLNLKWRHKLALPTVASLPLLVVYYVTSNKTDIVVPILAKPFLGSSIHLGIIYYLYMGLLAVFCTNAINIFSGINGLEVGQSLIIAISVALFNLREINGPLGDYHAFSLYFLIPFLATTLALFYYNWYPASAFCGDTFCYFAGMTLAVVAILGHFSKTLLLFFIPQILNFLLSTPQLFGLLPCPRHRLPKLDENCGALKESRVTFYEKELRFLGKVILNVLEFSKLVKVRREKNGVISMNNLTLVNLTIRIFGPTHEKTLTIILMLFQILFSVLAYFIRYPLALLFYEEIVA